MLWRSRQTELIQKSMENERNKCIDNFLNENILGQLKESFLFQIWNDSERIFGELSLASNSKTHKISIDKDGYFYMKTEPECKDVERLLYIALNQFMCGIEQGFNYGSSIEMKIRGTVSNFNIEGRIDDLLLKGRYGSVHNKRKGWSW